MIYLIVKYLFSYEHFPIVTLHDLKSHYFFLFSTSQCIFHCNLKTNLFEIVQKFSVIIPPTWTHFSQFSSETMPCAFLSNWVVSINDIWRKKEISRVLCGLGNLGAFSRHLVKVENSATSQFTLWRNLGRHLSFFLQPGLHRKETWQICIWWDLNDAPNTPVVAIQVSKAMEHVIVHTWSKPNIAQSNLNSYNFL